MNQQLQLPQQEEIHLQDYINVIMRRRYTFVASFIAVVIGVTLYTFQTPPSYESSATLFVKDDKGKVGQMGDLLLNNAAAVDSEIEILKSRSNAEKVVSKLHLDWQVAKLSDGIDFKLIEFSSSAEKPVYHVELLGGAAYAVKDDDENSVGNGTSGALMRGKGITLLLKDLKGKKGDSFRLALLSFNGTVEGLRKQIKAAEVGKKTNVIAITYRNRSPQLARDVVNTLVQAYLDQGVALKSEEATRTVGFVEEQLKGVKSELEDAEKNLETYKRASGVIQLDAEAKNLIQTLSDTEKLKAGVVLQKKQVEFALASLKDSRRRGAVYSPAMSEDSLVSGMAAKLSELEIQKKGLLSESTGNHPGVKTVQGQIDEVQRKIQATYETSLSNLAKQEDSISREISRQDASLKNLPAAERDLARLMRLQTVNSNIYTFLLQKHEEARIAQASTINNISIVDPAIVADDPVSPQKKKNLLLGLIVGFMSGVGLCFFREYLDDTLKNPEQAKRAFTLPLLAVIPFIAKKEGVAALISHNQPKSPASEAFRALRTGLHFSALNREKKVTLVTSSFSGEGKSTVSANLAITLAQTGARVLIIDCDLRRSSQHEIFGFDGRQGLTELLAGDVTASIALKPTTIEGLDLMNAGTIPPNPAELLGSDAMQRFIEEMKGIYTHIVIDAPPVLAVTDAAVLCQLADLVLVVLEAGRVPAKAAQRNKEILISVAAPMAGFVISDKSVASQDYGYGYGYGYGYDVGAERKKPWWRFGRG